MDKDLTVTKNRSKEKLFVLILLILGLIYRLGFVYFFSGSQNAGVGWYGDTYHHWQIGYLTYTTGLKTSFLRLWDLKGMEYFWGPVHPLLLSFIFTLTGSNDIVITRYVSILFGLGSLLLLYLLSKRYWDKKIAYAILFFGVFFPISVFNDASGMLEPIGLFLLLLGIYFFPKLAFLTGVSWAVSTMVRAEAWTFSIGLIIGVFFYKKHGSQKGLVLLGWVIIILIYMKYLLDSTGNAIYPLWWNYLANATGAWADVKRELTPLQQLMKPILLTVAGISLMAILYTLIRRPKSMLLLLLGWGNIFFLGAFMGASHYLTGWEWWFPVIRFFVFPYLFIALIIFIILEKVKINSHPIWNFVFGFIVLVVTLATQATWIPITSRFGETLGVWTDNTSWASEVGKYYKGGKVLFPEGEPNFTYAVVKYTDITGENIIGQMFDPFYYIGEKEAFANWKKHRKEVLSFIKEKDIRLAVFRKDTTRYRDLVKKEKKYFKKLAELKGGVYEIWEVYPDKIKL